MTMDRVRHEKLTILFHHAVEYQFLKKLSKWLISVSVFSLLFLHSPVLPLLHSYNFYFSTFPFQLFSHTIDKNCIFLLSNGLLFFVAKYSGLIRSLSRSSQNDETFKYNEFDHTQSESLVLEFNESSLKMQVFVGKAEFDQKPEAVEKVTRNDSSIEAEHIQTSTSSEEYYSVPDQKGICPIALREDPEVVISEEETHPIFYVEDEEEQEEEASFVIEENLEDKEVLVEEHVILSTEELNKKFDEFIRRMKEDLRLQARRQLVMV